MKNVSPPRQWSISRAGCNAFIQKYSACVIGGTTVWRKWRDKFRLRCKHTISQGRDAFIGSSLRCDSALHATNPPNPVHIKAQWSCSLSVAKLHCITKHNTVSLAYNQNLNISLTDQKICAALSMDYSNFQLMILGRQSHHQLLQMTWPESIKLST